MFNFFIKWAFEMRNGVKRTMFQANQKNINLQ